jgi:putative copper export protein
MTADALRALLRYAHLLAAVAWVGGSLFYALVLRPSLAQAAPDEMPPGARAAIGERFRAVVQACIVVFVVSGVPLAFDRLSQSPTLLYAALLWLKIGLSVWMLLLAYGLRVRRRAPRRQTGAPRPWLLEPENQVLAVGLAILLLVTVLRVTYEAPLQQ